MNSSMTGLLEKSSASPENVSEITELERKLVSAVPSERQLKHQKLEFYGFFHFTVNTFTDREWGDGSESPTVFNPANLDAAQWVRAVKKAGMKGAILTCKHHDGFCLWPSIYTDHTVAASPYKSGHGDVVREVSEACKAEGLKFGVYLSPWDRHEPCYGTGKPYDDYFVNQLEELLTGYGDIFCVWLDGACGEGSSGKVQRYDWDRYYEVIRRWQPEACISVCGPDVRWCGNEAGDTRPEEWSVVSGRLRDTERIQEKSQQSEDETFRTTRLTSSDQDLGSRTALQGETELMWYPAEVDVSIRPGWFYHEKEDNCVRSLKNLVQIYDSSVGGNAMLLLNVPPAPSGLLHEADVARLEELGDYIRGRQRENLAEKAGIVADPSEPGYEIDGIFTDDGLTYYKTVDGVRYCDLLFSWEAPVTVSWVFLKEDIRMSQRIEKFQILDDETGNVLFNGTTVGYQKIAGFSSVTTKAIRIRVLESRVAPTLSFVGIYK